MNVTIFWVCASIALVVFGVMIYSVATFRGSHGASETRVTFRHNTLVEILWALIPIVILVSAALPAIKMLAPITLASESLERTLGMNSHE